MQSAAEYYKLIFVDDKSTDDSLEVLKKLTISDDKIVVISLASNVGQQSAIAAGLDYAEEDIVVVMDADLQDNPEDIPALLKKLLESGANMSIARTASRGDSLCRKLMSQGFHIATRLMTKLRIEPGLRNFRAVRREALDKLKPLVRRSASALSLLHRNGTGYETVDLPRSPRFAGKSAYSFIKMLKIFFNRLFVYGKYPPGLVMTALSSAGLFLLLTGIWIITGDLILEKTAGLLLLLASAMIIYTSAAGWIFLQKFMKSADRPHYEIAGIFNRGGKIESK